MIRITLFKNGSDKCYGFKLLGHAGYAESGEDIVCSAVSALTINTINAIETFTEDDFSISQDEETGMIEFMMAADPLNRSSDSQLLLDTLVLGLSSIEEQYSEFIQLEFEISI